MMNMCVIKKGLNVNYFSLKAEMVLCFIVGLIYRDLNVFLVADSLG